MNIDTSIRRIVITEEEDLDLDKLLKLDDGTSDKPSDKPAVAILTPPSSPSSPTSPKISILEEEEEDEDGGGHWVLPKPSKPGDFMNNSIKRVPSKSILKKTSSYANFDTTSSQTSNNNKSVSGLGRRLSSRISLTNNLMDASSTSIRSNNSGSYKPQQVADSSSSGGGGGQERRRRAKQSSFLGSMTSDGGSSAIGWDLDDDESKPSSPSIGKFIVNVPPPKMPTLGGGVSIQQVVTASCGADQAAGMNSRESSRVSLNSSLGNSNNPRIRRNNVSFHSVDVREYDRTVGDNPSCRSGPPLSLDWSYSKKYEKNLEEYEAERQNERAKKLSQLHMNKYKRKNLLAFHWGHTEEDMKEARGSTRKVQRQRSMTQILLPVHLAEEAVISLKRFINKKKGKTEEHEWSDMSNSASTKDTTQPRDSPGIPSSHQTV